jgi:hypothetical protein
MFRNRNVCGFWNSIRKSTKKKKVNSALNSQDFADYFSNVMNGSGPLSEQQQDIKTAVKKHFEKNLNYKEQKIITPEEVSNLIVNMKLKSSPGHDGITSEHLVHGKSHILCKHLGSLYSTVMSWNVVPDVFKVGVIIPVLKKSTLNTNDPCNYRPITLSSVHSKIVEQLMIPPDKVSDMQFGFRAKRGTSFGCRLLNDVACYQNQKGSPLYICSLDAEKCFDRIWHAGLFFKLWGVIPLSLACFISMVLYVEEHS